MAVTRRLVAGCGYLGTALARHWLEAGHEVTGLRRHWQDPPAGLHALEADLLDATSLRGLPEELDVVVYAAAPEGRSDEAYVRAFVRGVRTLADRLHKGSPGLRAFLFVSSTAVYARRDGRWVDEDSPTEPLHFSGRRLLEGEAEARRAPGTCCAVRFGGIYGPGRTGLLERVRRGEARWRPRFTNRIHLSDAVGVLAHLAELPRLPPRILAVDEDPAPEREVLEWLARQLRVPAPAPALLPVMAREVLGNRRCRNHRLLATGYRFRFPSYREGYRSLLEEGDLERVSVTPGAG